MEVGSNRYATKTDPSSEEEINHNYSGLEGSFSKSVQQSSLCLTKTDSHFSAPQCSIASKDEEPLFVSFDFQGDGRKREAKRHKSRTMIAREEIELENFIRDY